MELVIYPDPILRKRAQRIGSVDDSVRARVADMFELMYREFGVGLAAPQVGWSVRLFVMNPMGPEERDAERVFINPKILSADGSEIDEEGCLSIPDVRGRVERSATIEVEAQGLDGEMFRESLESLPARIVQHENDHLDGILFTSRLSESELRTVNKSLKALEKEYRQRRKESGRKP